MSWDQRYRRLEMGEIILETDEVMKDDGTWIVTPNCVGTPAPDPAYTSHRWYRRLMTPAPDVERARSITAQILGYKDWDDATDYRTTGAQDRERDRVLAIVTQALALSRPQTDGGEDVCATVYEAAVKGRQDFREAYRKLLPVQRAAEQLSAYWRTNGMRVDSDEFFDAIAAVDVAVTGGHRESDLHPDVKARLDALRNTTPQTDGEAQAQPALQLAEKALSGNLETFGETIRRCRRWGKPHCEIDAAVKETDEALCALRAGEGK